MGVVCGDVTLGVTLINGDDAHDHDTLPAHGLMFSCLQAPRQLA